MLASEKSLLCSSLPTSLPSKAKNHNVLHKGHTQWLRVACLLHLFALGVHPGGWAWPSIPFLLTDTAAWLTPVTVHPKMKRHEMTWNERCSWTTFPAREGKEWSYSCLNSWLKMWPQCIWKWTQLVSPINESWKPPSWEPSGSTKDLGRVANAKNAVIINGSGQYIGMQKLE